MSFAVSEQLLVEVAEYHLNAADYLPPGVEYIEGQAGRDRIVYVDHDYELVYKLCRQPGSSANREEVRVLAALRAEGAGYAPPAELAVVQVDAGYGDVVEVDIVVMPYLPDEGTAVDDRPVLPGAGDFNQANTHWHQGQWWLIDAAGM